MPDVRIGGAFVDFRARNANFLSKLRQSEAALRRQRRGFRNLRQEAARTNQILGRLTVGVTAVTAALGAGGAISPWLRYGDQMAAVGAITQATQSEFVRLETSAKNLARATRFTAAEAAEGQRELATAGFRVSEIISALPTTLRLAQAGQIGLGEAANIAAGTLNAFRLSAEESDRVANVLAGGLTRTATTLTQLGDALSYAGPPARALNVNIETTTAALGVLANNMLTASSGGTGLRRVLLRLLNPTADGAAVFRQYGIAAAEIDVQTRGLIPVLERLRDAQISNVDLARIFSTLGFNPARVLIDNVDGIRELTEAYENQEITLEQMVARMDDTAYGAVLRFASAVDGLRTAVIESTGAGERFKTAFDAAGVAINTWTDNIGDVNAALAGTAAVVGILAGRAILRGLIPALAAAQASVAITSVALQGRLAGAMAGVLAATGGFSAGMARAAASTVWFTTRVYYTITSLTGLRAALLSTAVLARGAAARAVGITLATAFRTLTYAVGLAKLAISTFLPFAVIAGIFEFGRYLYDVGGIAKDLGITFKDAAIVIAADFTGFLIKQFFSLPDYALRALQSLASVFVQSFLEIGRFARDSLIEGLFGTLTQRIERVGAKLTEAEAELERARNFRERRNRQNRVDQLRRDRDALLLEQREAAQDQTTALGRIFESFAGQIRERTFLAAGTAAGAAARQAFLDAAGLTPDVIARANAARDQALPAWLGGEGRQPSQDDIARAILDDVVQNQALASARQLTDALADSAAGAGEVSAALEEQVTAREIIAGLARQEADSIRDEIDELVLTERELARVRFVRAAIIELQRQGVGLTQTAIDQIRQEADALDSLISAREAAEETRRAIENIEQLGPDLSRSFKDFARAAIRNFDDIGDAAAALGDRILTTLIDRLFLNPIFDQIVDPFFSSIFSVGAAQHGGVHRGLTLVGEAGPEIVDFRNPSRVYTNDQLGAAIRGGENINITFAPVINGNDPAANLAMLRNYAYPEFERLIENKFVQEGRRPSRLRTAFGG